MNRRDRDLLNKQFSWLTPKPRSNGRLILAIVGVFFAGVALGGSLSAHEDKPASVASKVAVAGSFIVR